MKKKYKINHTVISFLLIFSMISCSDTGKISEEDEKNIKNETLLETSTNIEEEKYSDWTKDTHTNDATLDYDTVFPQNSVNRIDIVIDEENWQTMMDNMTSIYGVF
jgi:hypothetical protein